LRSCIPLADQVVGEVRQPGDIAAGSREALDEPVGDRIADGRNDDGNGGRGAFGGERRQGARRHDHIDVQPDELCRARSEPFGLAVGIPVLDHEVAPFDVAEITEPLAEGVTVSRIDVEVQDQIADPGRLLRRGGERRNEAECENDH
jgi:hypothetical protein